ncbi:dihydroorotase [Polymorphobacter fuscus]|uniref:Amidohydrolase family protein n=1 Tax=Sandarakinorhabdus fusca TaxID=1439888 RepID=A0A7C9GMP6_9SPHN|nr:dihydroorotase [Polymorphobacter fuscus]KAB7648608.1 dihydroorotase [Polymorphobacter fuscus]MQT16157.1 amidohydrolase family protein [Polymorphobacter fuscus]NJC07564.1 dihydroorotase [Polymorphobacter fuscus]
MTLLAITGGRVIDPASGFDGPATVVLVDRVIASVGRFEAPDDAEIIDASGLVVAPGLIDAGVFQASPAACHAGGITRVVLMPDQRPPLDDPALVAFTRGAGKPDVWVHPLVAATRGLAGQELAEIGLGQAAGAVGAATGRGAIDNSAVMHRLLSYATAFNLPVVTHAEDGALTAGAVATEGDYATRLGLPAAPAFAEALAVARDIRLAEATGARIHIRQLTTAEGITLVRAAQARGVAVTAGITPAHWLLNETAVAEFRSFARLSPPLRSDSDRRAVQDAIADGTIGIIASGHDPRTQEDKRLPFADALPGMAGAETLLALSLSLVQSGALTLTQLLATMTVTPARLFGLPGGTLATGSPADLVVFDEVAPWRIDGDRFQGAGNTPFDGLPVSGRVRMTIKGGDVVWRS